MSFTSKVSTKKEGGTPYLSISDKFLKFDQVPVPR